MDLLGSIGNITDLKAVMVLEQDVLDAFEYTSGHVIQLWGILILFIVIFSILSIFFINRIKFEKK